MMIELLLNHSDISTNNRTQQNSSLFIPLWNFSININFHRVSSMHVWPYDEWSMNLYIFKLFFLVCRIYCLASTSKFILIITKPVNEVFYFGLESDFNIQRNECVRKDYPHNILISLNTGVQLRFQKKKTSFRLKVKNAG